MQNSKITDYCRNNLTGNFDCLYRFKEIRIQIANNMMQQMLLTQSERPSRKDHIQQTCTS